MTATPTQWYVRTNNGASGPYTTQQIKDFANNGKLPRQASIAKSQDGPWTVAEKAKGLFPDLREDSDAQPDDEIRASDFVPDVVKNSATAISSSVSGITKSIATKINKMQASREAKARAKEEAIEVEKAKAKEVSTPATPPPVTQVDTGVLSLLQSEPIRSVESQIVQSKKCPFCTAEVPGDAIRCRYCAEFIDGRNISNQQSVPTAIQTVYVQNPVPRWNPGTAAVLSFIIPGLGQIYKGQILNGLLWMILVPIGYVFLIFPGICLHLCCILGASQGDPYR